MEESEARSQLDRNLGHSADVPRGTDAQPHIARPREIARIDLSVLREVVTGPCAFDCCLVQ